MNIITITGHLTADVEQKEVKGNNTLRMFTLANSIGWGEKKESMFWNVLIWNNRHDKILPWLKKGRMVVVVGNLHSRPEFFQKDGKIKANNLQVTAEMIHFLPDRKPEEKKEEVNNDVPF